MNSLSFYVSEKRHYNSMPLYEWLLEEARSLGVNGGSVFRAIAGFGRHGQLHEEIFFELAGELAVKVEFIVDDTLTERIMQRLRTRNLHLFYQVHKVESGII